MTICSWARAQSARQLPIPPEFCRGDYENDAEFRARFQGWISGRWAEKDALITRMQAE